jgi:glycosyltransferase involved in cell wall biosynthesis
VTDPWLSVIMPTYNGAAFLGQTLASIEAQANHQVEVIAIDDGSTDNTLAILRGHSRHLDLRIISNERIGNWVANTNHGLAHARGRYVCFLHQDDMWLPDRLRVLRKLVQSEPEAAFYFHASRYIDSRGRWLGVWRSPLQAGRHESRFVMEHLLVQNSIAVPAPIFRREVVERVGGLDESLWYTADWDFWLKLAAQGAAVYYPRPLAAFRIHPLSQTAQGVARASDMRRQMDAVLNRHLHYWRNKFPQTDVERTARLSLKVNHALAAFAFGDHPDWLGLLSDFTALGPKGWYRFLHGSRIVERLAAQIRARWNYVGTDTAPSWGSRRHLDCLQRPFRLLTPQGLARSASRRG